MTNNDIRRLCICAAGHCILIAAWLLLWNAVGPAFSTLSAAIPMGVILWIASSGLTYRLGRKP